MVTVEELTRPLPRVRLFQVSVGGARGVMMVFAHDLREAILLALDGMEVLAPPAPMFAWDATDEWLGLSSSVARFTWERLDARFTGAATFDAQQGWRAM